MKNFLITFIALTSFLAFGKGDEQAKVLEVIGNALILTEEGKELEAKKLTKFTSGSTITTFKNSTVKIKLQDESVVSLEPETSVIFEELIRREGHNYWGSSIVLLTSGGVSVNVVKKFDGFPSFEINTPQEIAFAVKGTYFYTFYEDDSRDLWTVVKNGSVNALHYIDDDSEVIKKGQGIFVADNGSLISSSNFDWAKSLDWTRETSSIDLYSKRKATAKLRKSEIDKKFKKLSKRKSVPFYEDQQDEYEKLGYEEEQLGELVRISTGNSKPTDDDKESFTGGTRVTTAAVKKPEKMNMKKIVASIEKAGKSEQIANMKKFEIEIANKIIKNRSSNLCIKAKYRGFSCEIKPQCAGSTPYPLSEFKYLGNISKIESVCIGCPEIDKTTKCKIVKNSCSSAGHEYIPFGELKYKNKKISLCMRVTI